MLDFNSSSSLSDRVTTLIDIGMQHVRGQQAARDYLGASRLAWPASVRCSSSTPKRRSTTGATPGRMLRIFERGHVMEDCMVAWLCDAGFDLRTQKPDGGQFGFSDAHGRLRGHVDGVIVGGPDGFGYPALWENKCLGAKSWRELEAKGPLSPPRRWRSIRPTATASSTRRCSRSTPTDGHLRRAGAPSMARWHSG